MDLTNSLSNTISKLDNYEMSSMSYASLQDARRHQSNVISNERILKGDSILDTYEVTSDAISGGMGSVWRVHHNSWNVELAMKRPQPRFFAEGSAERKEQFIDECQNWIDLGLHPNIVSCYYIREIGGVPSIFSEWMDGGSLKEAIQSRILYEGTGEEVQERILDIAIQSLWGILYSHERDLVHQDIKPGNILLTKAWEAKAADFGLARARSRLEEGEAYAGHTTGYTLAYCPREQSEGAEPAPWMDLFAWALTVLEMYVSDRSWKKGADVKGRLQECAQNPRVEMPAELMDCISVCVDDPASCEENEISDRLLGIYRDTTGREYPRPEPQTAGTTADTLNNYALSMLDLGMTETALLYWDEALRRFPDHQVSVYNQSLYEWRTGAIDDTEMLHRCETAGKIQGYEKMAERWIAQVNAERGEDPSNLGESVRAIKQNYGINYGEMVCSPDGKYIYNVPRTEKSWIDCYSTDTLQLIYSADLPAFKTKLSISKDGKNLFYVSGESSKSATHLVVLNTIDGSLLNRLPVEKFYYEDYCIHPDGKHCFTHQEEKLTKWNYITGEAEAVIDMGKPIRRICLTPDGRMLLVQLSNPLRSRLKTEEMYMLDASSMEHVYTWTFDEKKKTPFDAEKDFLREMRARACMISFDHPEAFTYDQVVSFINGKEFILNADRTRLLRRHEGVVEEWDTSVPRCLCTLTKPREKRYVSEICASSDLSLTASLTSSNFILAMEGEERNQIIWLQNGILESHPAPWELSEAKSYIEVTDTETEAARMADQICSAMDQGDLGKALKLLVESEKEYGAHRYFSLYRQLTRSCVQKDPIQFYEAAGFSAQAVIAFDPSSNETAVGEENKIRFFDDELNASGELDAQDTVLSLCYSWNGNMLAAALPNSLRIWDTKSSRLLYDIQYTHHPSENHAKLAFTPDDRDLVYFRSENETGVIDLESSLVTHVNDQFRGGQSGSILFSPDGRQMYIGGFIMDYPDLRERMAVSGGAVIGLLRSEHKLVMKGKNDITIWDALAWKVDSSFELIPRTFTRSTPAWRLARMRLGACAWGCVTPDEKNLILGYEKSVLEWWSLPGQKMIMDLPFPEETIRRLYLSPDGCVLAVVTKEKTRLMAIRRELELKDPETSEEMTGSQQEQPVFVSIHEDRLIRKGALFHDEYEVMTDAEESRGDLRWRVRNKEQNTDLAMLRPDICYEGGWGDRQKERFTQQFDRWIRLGHHDQIISCDGVREIDGLPTVFTEWMDFGSVRDKINDGSLYSGTEEEIRDRILQIALRIAQGLQYAHGQNVVHENIKPEKILLTEDWQVKINDFRNARAYRYSTTEEAMMPKNRVYTRDYCNSAVGNASRTDDTYSWALTVMEMFDGKRYWKLGRYYEVYFAEKRKPRVPIPPEVWDILSECITGKDRYGNVTDDFSRIIRRLEPIVFPPEPEEEPETWEDEAPEFEEEPETWDDETPEFEEKPEPEPDEEPEPVTEKKRGFFSWIGDLFR